MRNNFSTTTQRRLCEWCSSICLCPTAQEDHEGDHLQYGACKSDFFVRWRDIMLDRQLRWQNIQLMNEVKPFNV
jgi:hypothetical protein